MNGNGGGSGNSEIDGLLVIGDGNASVNGNAFGKGGTGNAEMDPNVLIGTGNGSFNGNCFQGGCTGNMVLNDNLLVWLVQRRRQRQWRLERQC